MWNADERRGLEYAAHNRTGGRGARLIAETLGAEALELVGRDKPTKIDSHTVLVTRAGTMISRRELTEQEVRAAVGASPRASTAARHVRRVSSPVPKVTPARARVDRLFENETGRFN
jgi:hypothetical protein